MSIPEDKYRSKAIKIADESFKRLEKKFDRVPNGLEISHYCVVFKIALKALLSKHRNSDIKYTPNNFKEYKRDVGEEAFIYEGKDLSYLEPEADELGKKAFKILKETKGNIIEQDIENFVEMCNEHMRSKDYKGKDITFDDID